MKRIALLTNDKYFFKKCSLLMEGTAEVTDDTVGAQLIARTVENEDGMMLLAEHGERKITLPLPARLDDIISALTPDERCARLFIGKGAKEAFLDGARIKLTESEGALLSLLISGGGRFISREEILREVFPGKTLGIINVYIHYLREKLEVSGEKIITASRDEGYRIEKRFLGGEV